MLNFNRISLISLPVCDNKCASDRIIFCASYLNFVLKVTCDIYLLINDLYFNNYLLD
jgi:hypothetical protein